MALSEQVKDSLEEAKSNLKNALAFSARNEKPMIEKTVIVVHSAHSLMIYLKKLLRNLPNYN